MEKEIPTIPHIIVFDALLGLLIKKFIALKIRKLRVKSKNLVAPVVKGLKALNTEIQQSNISSRLAWRQPKSTRKPFVNVA